MKILVKILLILFLISTSVFCRGNTTNPKYKKLLLWDMGYEAVSDYFVDGIKYTDGIYSDYFMLFVDIPECCQRGESYIEIRYRKFASDSLLMDNKEIFYIEKESGDIPKYLQNSLNLTFLKEKPIVTFVTSLEHKWGGLDPMTLILWVYYENTLYKFSGVVPMHPDWDWNKTYEFEFDNNLKNKSITVYNTVVEMWNNYIEKYKIRYIDWYNY